MIDLCITSVFAFSKMLALNTEQPWYLLAVKNTYIIAMYVSASQNLGKCPELHPPLILLVYKNRIVSLLCNYYILLVKPMCGFFVLVLLIRHGGQFAKRTAKCVIVMTR